MPTPTPAPTPTPWKITEATNGHIYIGGHEWVLKMVDKVDFTTMPKEANAEFVCRAVNNFEYLLLAAKSFRDYLKLDGRPSKELEDIIAKAEEKL
jgi:hypothetical protein